MHPVTLLNKLLLMIVLEMVISNGDRDSILSPENITYYRVPQKKCPIAIVSLNLFQRPNYTFFTGVSESEVRASSN